MVAKVLISACLLGQRVRYDGEGSPQDSDLIEAWRDAGRIVAVCPEVAGGLGVPRAPAEIVGGTGSEVLGARATVQTSDGRDVTASFQSGAHQALDLVREHGIRVAVLKERSPSCGSGQIYDGRFSGTLRPGDGVTAALLKKQGVTVFGESQLAAAHAMLHQLDE